MWRVLTLALLMYLSLDFSDPNTPGALNFDPDQCVVVVQAHGLRAALPAPTAATLPPIATWILEFETAPTYSQVTPAARAPLRLPHVTRARAMVCDRAPAATDDH